MQTQLNCIFHSSINEVSKEFSYLLYIIAIHDHMTWSKHTLCYIKNKQQVHILYEKYIV